MRWRRGPGLGSFGVVVALVLALGSDAVGASTRLVPQGVSDICVDPGDPVMATSVEQVEELWVGVWIRCWGPSQYHWLPGDDVGIEMAADGRFFRIYEGSDGSLVRPEGVAQEGRWEVLDLTDMNGPGSYQTNLAAAGVGESHVFPSFFASPPSVSIDGGAHYQRWDGAAPSRDVPPGVGGGACGQPFGRVELTSVEQIEELLIGSWTLCGDPLPLRPARADEIGIEFRADGRYVRLIRGEDGGVVAGGAPSLEGSWEVHEGDPLMEGPEPFDVLLLSDGEPGWPNYRITVMETPTFIRFSGYEAWSDYLAGAPPAALPPTGSRGAAPMLTIAVVLIALGLVATAVATLATGRRSAGSPSS